MIEYKPVVRDGKPSDALVIHCSDPDFQGAFREFIAGLGIGKYDPIVEPGPSKLITEDAGVVDRAKVLWSLHKFGRAVILDHINCGGFGIPDEEAEIVEHFRYAKLAQEVLKQALPSAEVEFHLLGWSSEISDPAFVTTATNRVEV